jgi:hypothetical protein
MGVLGQSKDGIVNLENFMHGLLLKIGLSPQLFPSFLRNGGLK